MKLSEWKANNIFDNKYSIADKKRKVVAQATLCDEQAEEELKKLKHEILALQDGKMISVVWLKRHLLGPSIAKEAKMKLSERLIHDPRCPIVDWESEKDTIDCDCPVSEVAQLEVENTMLKRITSEFGGYKVSELLKVIADDYISCARPSAHIVMKARSMWLIDFADALLTAEEQE